MFWNIIGGIVVDIVCNEVFVFDDDFLLYYQLFVDILDLVIVVYLIFIYIVSFGKISEFYMNFGIYYLYLQIDVGIY